ncbi:N-acetylmuramic acid 6-phosphate etherase [soil metagenome]
MNNFIRTTEQSSLYRHIEKMSVHEILIHINEEDKKVAPAVEKALPQIEKLIEAITDKMLAGGRLFYIGAGTSGRLGILDASECPPTFGVSPDIVKGIIAGGEKAITSAVENAEDNAMQGWSDLQSHHINETDFVVGIAASGTTPYVISALQNCLENKIETGCITCNSGSPLAAVAEHVVEVVIGPEFITGSTRMKSGTAQKMVLNMISTTVMIKLGRVQDNRMVNMQLTNEKLRNRAIDMLMQTGINEEKAKQLLEQYGSVKKAMDAYKSK